MRPSRFALALCLAGGLTTSTALAAPVTITFDELTDGTTVTNQYAALGVLFVPNAFTGANDPPPGWATNTALTIGSITGFDLGTPQLVSGNILHPVSAWFAEDGDASFRATFSGAGITTLSATFAGILSGAAEATRLIAYDDEGLVVMEVNASPDAEQQVLTVSSATPIRSVVFTPGDYGDWVVVDNITFTPAADVPEPMTLTLFALGVAAAARSRRRQRRIMVR